MLKRWKTWLLTFCLVGIVLCALESQRILTGWLRGEEFYKGRPTSYWRWELEAWEVTVSFACGPPKEGGGGLFCKQDIHWTRQTGGLKEKIWSWLQLLPTSSEPPLLTDDPAVLPVLAELDQDQEGSLVIKTLVKEAKARIRYRAEPNE